MTIKVCGAKTHNLQNVSLELSQNRLIVLTGVSGSGKSSLALDTLAAEGMRRFLEGLSPRMRALFSKSPRPDVDAIENLPPTTAIAFRGEFPGKKATVASLTGCDFLLHGLFSHHSLQHSPKTGKLLKKYDVGGMADEVLKGEGRLYILAPLESVTELEGLTKMGYTRALVDGKEWDLSEELPKRGKKVLLVVDRITIKEGIKGRLLESLSLAVKVGQGSVKTWDAKDHFESYSTSYAEGNALYSPLTPSHFQERSPQVLACILGGKNIAEVEALPVDELLAFSKTWKLDSDLLTALQKRLTHLSQLGLGYLTLDRPGNTLSVGELQRVQLTGQLASDLTGLLLVLDEPTRGLHRKDVATLLTLLQKLKEQGNTLLVVEHEPHVIQQADEVIELQSGALSFQGAPAALLKSECLTGRYLSGKESPPASSEKPTPDTFVHVKNASCHNLQNVSLDIPLNRLVAFCGVSGSGKSTLLLDYLLPRLSQRVIAVDQDPLGLSPRSLPLTAVGLMTPLRTLLSQTPLAKARGLTAAHFSLAKPGGRCENCQGRGFLQLEMGFLPSAEALCDVCEGKRYNAETLQVTWKGHSPADIMSLTAEEAFALFSEIPQMADRLVMMTQLGLGYLKLGQPLPTLSSGEIQRLKLIGQLAKRAAEPTLYILDEPSSGLHLHDLSKLLEICHQLIAQGHTVWMIEHHLSMITCADWVIELGPGAGPKGGKVVFEGTPAAFQKADTPTANVLNNRRARGDASQ